MINFINNNILRPVAQVLFFPIRVVLSVVMLPYSVINQFATNFGANRRFSVDLERYNYSASAQTDAILYVPGNGMTQPGYIKNKPKQGKGEDGSDGHTGDPHQLICFAPPGYTPFKLFSLHEAARDLADTIEATAKIDHFKTIKLYGISMGGATIVLALDILKKEGRLPEKLEKIFVANTFNSLTNVVPIIIQLTSPLRYLFRGLLAGYMHVLYRVIIGAAPISLFRLVILLPALMQIASTGVSILFPANAMKEEKHTETLSQAFDIGLLFAVCHLIMPVSTGLYAAFICSLPFLHIFPAKCAALITWLMHSEDDVKDAYASIRDTMGDKLYVQQTVDDQLLQEPARLIKANMIGGHMYVNQNAFDNQMELCLYYPS